MCISVSICYLAYQPDCKALVQLSLSFIACLSRDFVKNCPLPMFSVHSDYIHSIPALGVPLVTRVSIEKDVPHTREFSRTLLDANVAGLVSKHLL